MRVIPYIDNREINDPINLSELSIELNFDKDNPTSTVSVNEWELGVGKKTSTGKGGSNDGANLLNKHINNGITGGVGALEGIPFRIDIDSAQAIETVFDGYLDTSRATISCNKVTAKAIESGGIDWLNDVADSFTFEYLAKGLQNGEPGKITEDDYIMVPYIISAIPNAREAALVLVTAFVATQAIKESITNLQEYVAGLSGNPLQFGNVLSIILRIAYLVVLIATVVKMLIDFFNYIIQPVKYHAAMYISDLCDKGAEYLGLTFESSIIKGLYAQAAILPEKNAQAVDSKGILGFLGKSKNSREGYYKGTFGDLLRELKSKFYAKIVIDGTIIRLESRNYNISKRKYQIPPIEIDEHRLNADELISNYSIKYQTDINDKNTIQEYEGTAIQVQTLPKTITNRDMVLTRGYTPVTIPFALGKPKTELTVPEKIFDVLFEALDVVLGAATAVVNALIGVVNAIIKLINKILKVLKFIGLKIKNNLKPVKKINPPSLGNLIDNRIGMLKMETDFVAVPKIIMIGNNSDARNNKLLPTNSTLLNAEYLWDNYHSESSFDSDLYEGNQYIIKQVGNVPFCKEDFDKVKRDNRIIDSNGVDSGIIDSLTWNPVTRLADINFRIFKIWTKNLRTVKIIPNGE